MRVTICSSYSEQIDEKYKKSATLVCKYLSEKNFDLNFGSGSLSIMGICYNVFNKYNRKIYGYTSPKYVDDIINLPAAIHNVFDTTFDLKKNIFNDADLVLFLPGGTGTISEFFSFLEEVRSNDINKKLIIYNQDNHFDKVISLIDDLVKRNFNDNIIYNYFVVANTFDEFKDIIDDFINKK